MTANDQNIIECVNYTVVRGPSTAVPGYCHPYGHARNKWAAWAAREQASGVV